MNPTNLCTAYNNCICHLTPNRHSLHSISLYQTATVLIGCGGKLRYEIIFGKGVSLGEHRVGLGVSDRKWQVPSSKMSVICFEGHFTD